jgi:cell division protein FtsB
MAILGELRRRARHIAAPVVGICLVGYFVYHTVQGERGILSFLALQSRLREAEALAAVTEAERLEWEHRVRLLRPASLDADLLDEQARLMLNVGRADEVVILRPWGRRQAPDSEH